MTEAVCGEWKDFVFQMATLADASKIEKHVRDYFLKDEPLNALMGWCETKAEEHDRLVRSLIEQGLSFVVLQKDTNEVCITFSFNENQIT